MTRTTRSLTLRAKLCYIMATSIRRNITERASRTLLEGIAMLAILRQRNYAFLKSKQIGNSMSSSDTLVYSSVLTGTPFIFCHTILSCDITSGFRDARSPVLESFLRWTLCQKIGKNGRKKRGTTTKSSLNAKWKNLQIVYKVHMGKAFEPRIYNDMTVVGGTN